MNEFDNFAAVVETWANKAKVATLDVVIEMIGIVNATLLSEWPVETGFSRASWFASLDAPPSGQAGMGGGGAQLEMVASQLTIGRTYYLGNTAAYARRLELGFVGTDSLGRQYNQQGRFVLRRTMERAPQIAEAAARNVAARNGGGV